MARKPRERTSSKVPSEVRELGEHVGKLIEFWGFKRIHGETWLHLFFAEEPLDAGDLIARLDISKSLASLCLAELIHYDVIREQGKSEAGTTLYVANEDVLGVIANVLRIREKVMLDRVAKVAEKVSNLSEETRRKAGLRVDRVSYVSELASDAAGMFELLLGTGDSADLESALGPELASGLDRLRAIATPPPEGPRAS